MYHVFLALFNVYMDAVMEMGKRGESGFDLALVCSMVRLFVEVCRRKGLKVIAGKSKMMVLNGEKGLECVVHIDGICL